MALCTLFILFPTRREQKHDAVGKRKYKSDPTHDTRHKTQEQRHREAGARRRDEEGGLRRREDEGGRREENGVGRRRLKEEGGRRREEGGKWSREKGEKGGCTMEAV